jgi:hypothetical protein
LCVLEGSIVQAKKKSFSPFLLKTYGNMGINRIKPHYQTTLSRL